MYIAVTIVTFVCRLLNRYAKMVFAICSLQAFDAVIPSSFALHKQQHFKSWCSISLVHCAFIRIRSPRASDFEQSIVQRSKVEASRLSRHTHEMRNILGTYKRVHQSKNMQ